MSNHVNWFESGSGHQVSTVNIPKLMKMPMFFQTRTRALDKVVSQERFPPTSCLALMASLDVLFYYFPRCSSVIEVLQICLRSLVDALSRRMRCMNFFGCFTRGH